MMGVFRRPVGALADLKELEYISALQQSAVPLRTDATVSATDVLLFLRSRHGLVVEFEEAIDIVRGLGGTYQHRPIDNGDNDEEECSSGDAFGSISKYKVSPTGVESLNVPHHASTVEKTQDLEQGQQTTSEVKNASDPNIQNADSRKGSAAGGEAIAMDSSNGSELKPKAETVDSNKVFENEGNTRSPSSSKFHRLFCRKQEEPVVENDIADEYLDLVQLTSLILIPTIASSVKEMSLVKHRHNLGETLAVGEEQNYHNVPPEHDTLLPSPIRHPITYVRNRLNRRRLEYDKEERAFRQSIRPKPNIVRDVLRLLIHSVDEARLHESDSTEKNSLSNTHERLVHDRLPPLRHLTIDKNIIRSLLLSQEEFSVAQDDDLINSMVEVAGGVGTVFDEVSFANALTHDISEWDAGCEGNLTSTFQDVYGYELFNKREYNLAVIAPSGPNAEASATGQHAGVVSQGSGGIKGSVEGTTSPRSPPEQKHLSEKRMNNGQLGLGKRSGMEGRDSLAEIRAFPSKKASGQTALSDSGNSKKRQTSGLKEDAKDSGSALTLDQEDGNESNDIQTSPSQGPFNSAELRSSASPSASVKVDSTMQKEGRSHLPPDDQKSAKTPVHVPMALTIDSVVDAFFSIWFTMLLWVFYIFCVGVFFGILQASGFGSFDCSQSFACTLGEQIASWLGFALVLTGGGLIIMVPISLGNEAFPRDLKALVFSGTVLSVYNFLSFFGLEYFKRGIPHSSDGVLTSVEERVNQWWVEVAAIIYFVFGNVLLAKLATHIIALYIPGENISNFPFFRRVLMASYLNNSSKLKLSGAYKTNQLIENARKLHLRSHDEAQSRATVLDNFMWRKVAFEDCGGFLFTWKRMLSREIKKKDGVFLHSRLFVGQEAQIVLWAFMVYFLFYWTEEAAQNVESRRDEVEQQPDSQVKDWYLELIPEGWMIHVSFYPAGIIALCAGLVIISLYIPSTTGTILKLRCGVIETLHDPEFSNYSKKADLIFYNLGNMIYALAGSMGFCFVLFGVIIFLCVWPITTDGMILILAWIIGLVITILLKTIILKITRSKFSAALFRRLPRKSNYQALAMECWHIGLGGGVLIARLMQFLMASAFWIGRIDAVFLDKNVSILNYAFDYVPMHYRREILVHEAHKHPYIERLGAMYLMRMKHGTNFSSDAGACWRRLFVFALMPWLQKYSGQGEHLSSEDDSLFSSLLLLSKNAPDTAEKSKILSRGLLRVAGRRQSISVGGKNYQCEKRSMTERKKTI